MTDSNIVSKEGTTYLIRVYNSAPYWADAKEMARIWNSPAWMSSQILEVKEPTQSKEAKP